MKHPRSVHALTTAGVSLMIAALAWASPGEDRFPISVEKLEARSAEAFANVDADGDGMISMEEFAAHRPERGGHGKRMPGHHRHHGHHDGADSSANHQEHMAQMDSALFEALDSNGTGAIEASEFSSEALADARRSIMKQHLFDRLDDNDDGVLTPDEFPPRRMAGLDSDGDGKITREELHDGRTRHWRKAG